MTAWYREIEVVQEPMDLGLDGQQRSIVAFNINVVKRPSDTFLEELTQLLVTAGVGVFNTNIFNTSAADLPNGDGPFLTLVETGGTSPERTQNDIGPPAYPRPSAQVAVHGVTYAVSRAMARAAYNALVGIRNTNVTG